LDARPAAAGARRRETDMDIKSIGAIDTVVNIWTEESLRYRPSWRDTFYGPKMKVPTENFNAVSLERMIEKMDEAGIARGFLVSTKCGALGPASTYHLPVRLVADAVQKYPDRFRGLAGIDPTEGMRGVREFETAVKEYGFIGGHVYPHWFELAPDHARYYPFYAKCCELDVPIVIHVGQSMIYAPDMPRRSVAKPITLDGVACDFQELRIVGSHIGIPWTDEMIAMCWKHPNVYIASDAHAPKYWPQSLIHYINTFGQDKVMFGTDFPVLDFKKTMDQISDLNFRPHVLPKFMRETAEKVFKLKP
jgi:predicted TIM-barrel fold metal-dependent hydrolase